jgi:hypothetical protein
MTKYVGFVKNKSKIHIFWKLTIKGSWPKIRYKTFEILHTLYEYVCSRKSADKMHKGSFECYKLKLWSKAMFKDAIELTSWTHTFSILVRKTFSLWYVMQPDLFVQLEFSHLHFTQFYVWTFIESDQHNLIKEDTISRCIQKKYALHLLLHIPQYHFTTVQAAAYFLYYIDIFKHLYIVSAEVNKAVSELNVLTTQHVNLVACCIRPH